MAGRTNYRIKLDLSKYYHDARRFSWIYVNSTNIWFISHLKRHIKDIFDIEEPFHLLLNGNEYLPPAEDVRVLEENEIIVVERGSGMGHGSTNGGTSTMSLPVSDMENGFVKSTSTTDKEDPYVRERKPLDGVQLLNGSVASAVDADATRYHSIVADATATESSSDCKRNDDASVDSSILDAYTAAAALPLHKRKRIRRKKAKQTEERAPSPVLGGSSARREQTGHEKPKVIGSYALPSGTHIRFDNPDDGDNKTDNGTRGNTAKSVATLFKSPKADGLSRLLALGNCSSPLAFTNKKPKYENGSSMEQSSTAVTTGSPDDPMNGQGRDEYADLKPQEFPSLELSTEIGDVIAFKVLRIGSEYTPEVSDYIVAKTLARCPENTLYTFKILNFEAMSFLANGRGLCKISGYGSQWVESLFLGKRRLPFVEMESLRGTYYILSQGKKELADAARILAWNRWLLTSLGIWPKDPSQIRFGISFGYFLYHMTMEYLDLLLHIDNLEHVIMNLTENMAFSQILIRIAMLRRYERSLATVIAEVSKDFDPRHYRSAEETRAFIDYNRRSKLFVKLLSAFVVLTASSYFVKPLTAPQAPDSLGNFTNGSSAVYYELPYRFHVFYGIEDRQTYVLTYASQLPFVFVSGLGQSAADCLMVTLVFHICGQMSVLAMRLSRIQTNPNMCDEEELRGIVENHQRLLRMGTIVQEAFSETLLGHLIGATSLVCILGYQLLTNFAKGQNADLMTFVTFAFLVLLVLYAHCTVGESLIAESLNVCNAFYDCEWYNMPTKKARIIIICMARSQKPLCLTAGKFGIFCLSTLTEVLKTAMGYLSVLRTLL